MRVKDASDTPHVLCLGINLENALKQQVNNYDDFIFDLEKSRKAGKYKHSIKKVHAKEIIKLSRVLNIKWVSEALENNIDVTYINRRSELKENKKEDFDISWINDIKNDVIKSTE